MKIFMKVLVSTAVLLAPSLAGAQSWRAEAGGQLQIGGPLVHVAVSSPDLGQAGGFRFGVRGAAGFATDHPEYQFGLDGLLSHDSPVTPYAGIGVQYVTSQTRPSYNTPSGVRFTPAALGLTGTLGTHIALGNGLGLFSELRLVYFPWVAELRAGLSYTWR